MKHKRMKLFFHLNKINLRPMGGRDLGGLPWIRHWMSVPTIIELTGIWFCRRADAHHRTSICFRSI